MYGLRPEALADLIQSHRFTREAKTRNEAHLKAIEEMLTDRNFHTMAALLEAGEYEQALEQSGASKP